MCWQKLVTELCRQRGNDFSGPIREGADEICDLVLGSDASDTKYRIGSGDSGTLKKFRQYAERLAALKKRPVLLILRTDNLSAAINACLGGGWTIYSGNESYEYLRKATGFDLRSWFVGLKVSPPRDYKCSNDYFCNVELSHVSFEQSSAVVGLLARLMAHG